MGCTTKVISLTGIKNVQKIIVSKDVDNLSKALIIFFSVEYQSQKGKGRTHPLTLFHPRTEVTSIQLQQYHLCQLIRSDKRVEARTSRLPVT